MSAPIDSVVVETLTKPIFDPQTSAVIGSLGPIFVVNVPSGADISAPCTGAIRSIEPMGDSAFIMEFVRDDGLHTWISNIQNPIPTSDPTWTPVRYGQRVGTCTHGFIWIWCKGPSGDNVDPAEALVSPNGTSIFTYTPDVRVRIKPSRVPPKTVTPSAPIQSQSSGGGLALLGILIAIIHHNDNRRSRR